MLLGKSFGRIWNVFRELFVALFRRYNMAIPGWRLSGGGEGVLFELTNEILTSFVFHPVLITFLDYERASAASERSLFNITEKSQYERPDPA